MILKEVIQRLIRELEESSSATFVPVYSPSENIRKIDADDEESTASDCPPKDFE